MPRLDLIVVPAVALLAGIVVGAVLYRVGATDAVGAALVAGFITIVASYCDLILDRTAERARTQAAIDHVNVKQEQMRGESELTRRAVIELKLHLDDRMATRNDRVVSEVKVLESLVRKLAEGVAQKSIAYEPSEEERLPPRSRRAIAARVADDAPDDAMLEIIRRSLEENRVELYLQPIVSLPQRKTRFYEALSRLRAEDGTIIMPSQYIRIAEPAGLMSVVDNVLLFRCIQILRSWSQRNKDIGVFCNLSRETLQDAGFFTQFIEFMQQHRELAGLLIFEISQDTLVNCTPTESANLTHLADLGFTFSMDKVTTLDLDFALARTRQVRYFKVPAKLLLGDPEKAGARVHPADLKELLQRFGLNLIAERVEQERDVVNLLDYNVDYGQGFLFGEPQPIRETIAEQGHPRAAAPPQPRIRAVGKTA
ncbi:MAG: EAL domain-containing protein [Alphaproteobacteria bacterium]|nr:EAL domain-containing protein [Alphaproteobacteria bacterium]